MIDESQLSVSGDVVDRCLRLCLQARWDPSALEAARDLAARAGCDWEVLSEVAQEEGLASLLYRIVLRRDLLPAPIEQDLRLCYLRSARRNFFLFRQLERVLRRLADEGISVILLKGAALAVSVYGNPSVRPLADFDLLVRRGDVIATLDALEALGYEFGRVETRDGDFLAYENEIMLVRPGEEETLVEVHWSLFDSPYHQHRIPMDWFWRKALPISVGKATAWMLSPEAQVLHLCGHQLLHHGRGEPRLLWLHDVAEVIAFYGERMDWEQVLARAQAYDLVLPVQRVLAWVNEGGHVQIPVSVLERLRGLRPSRAEERVVARLTAAHRPAAHRFWTDLVWLPGWGAKLRFAWNSLFPSAAYMRHRYKIPGRLLLPMYYPYRWFLGLRSAVGGREGGASSLQGNV